MFVELLQVVLLLLLLLFNLLELFVAFGLQSRDFCVSLGGKVVELRLELTLVIVAIHFEFLHDVSEEVLEVVCFLLAEGLDCLHFVAGVCFEALAFCFVLGCQFGHALAQLLGLLLVVEFQFLHDVFVELLHVCYLLSVLSVYFCYFL